MPAHKNESKPCTIFCNGVEVPDPVREKLEYRQEFYTPLHFGRHNLNGAIIFYPCVWQNTDLDNIYLENGLIHLTEENARAWWTYFTRLAMGK